MPVAEKVIETSAVDTSFSISSAGGSGRGEVPVSLDEWRRRKLSWDAELPADFRVDAESIDYSLDVSRFPRNIAEFRERQKKVSLFERGISLLDLGVDFEKAFWAEVHLAEKLKNPNFLKGEEHLRGPVNIVFGQGLATYYGHDYFRRAAPWARNIMTHGTYNHPIQYLEGVGADVIVVKTDALINRGDVKKNKTAILEGTQRVRDRSNAPVYLLMHSVDALSAQVFMSENRQLASGIDGIFLVAGPLPDEVNPWVGDVFLAAGDKSDNFEYVEPVIDLYTSGDSRKMNIISIKDTPDRVLDGWAGGTLFPSSLDGHSSILHQHKNLQGIIYYINERSYPQKKLAA